MDLTIVAVSEPNKYPQFFRRLLQLDCLILPVLAALVPPDVNIRLIDETVHIKKPNYHKLKADMVALSVRTSCANRAYRISDLLRSRGITTVLGGIHPTVLPEESKRHADAVVIGEAEEAFPEAIRDFRSNRLRPFYRGNTGQSLDNLPLPRRDRLRLSNRPLVPIPTIQAGRGCPHRCSFCSVARVYGGTYRKRPVSDIIQELQVMKQSQPPLLRPLTHWRDRLLFFLDDNLLLDRRYAKELLLRLAPLNKRWYTQASVSIAKDLELLELARQAGCCILSLGLDSMVGESLKQVNKPINQPDFYQEAVERIHSFGIMVGASFIFGFDHDDAGVFEKTLDFAIDSGLDFASFHILTPYPGTPLFEQMQREERLLFPNGDWSRFDTQHVVFQPKNMSPEELQKGLEWVWKEFMSLKSIRMRGRQTANRWFFWPINLFLSGLFASPLINTSEPS